MFNTRTYQRLALGAFVALICFLPSSARRYSNDEESGHWYSSRSAAELKHYNAGECHAFSDILGGTDQEKADHDKVHRATGLSKILDHYHLVCNKAQTFTDPYERHRDYFPAEDEETFSLPIRDTTSKQFELEGVTDNTSVGQIKAMIEDREGKRADHLKLLYAGKRLDDNDKKVSEFFNKERNMPIVILPPRVTGSRFRSTGRVLSAGTDKKTHA